MPDVRAINLITQNAGESFVLFAAVVTAAGLLLRKGYRAFKLVESAVVQLVGTKEQPSLRDELAEVKAIALRSEKELHPNGGSSLRDDVRIVSTQLAQVKESADQATTAAGLAVNEAKVAANVAQEMATERRADVQRIQGSMARMREEIATEAAERTADALDLLAEHGGPDLRPHMPGGVPPHAHELPARHEPDLTGGPVLPEE